MIDSVEMIRFFTEFTLRQEPRPFASLRVTGGEGFRMTKRVSWRVLGQPLLCHSEPCPETSSGSNDFRVS